LHTLQVCGLGAVLGVAIAFASARVMEAWLRSQLPFAPAEALIRWHGGLAMACVACAIGLGSLAGFLPAWRAAQLSPAEAMGKGVAQL
jgi:ABC-type antimicrobial peptide transport system permease subunit